MKKLLLSLMFILLGTAAAIGVGEIVLRLAHHMQAKPQDTLTSQLEKAASTSLEDFGDTDKLAGLVRPSAHPEVIYELKPNLTGRFRGASVRTNSFGMRSPEIEKIKAPEVVRIAGIGDSVMFGWGLEEHDSYLRLLESHLRSAGYQVEVLNFAVPGYNTAMEVAAFEHKVLQFNPDIVVIHFVNNDLSVPFFMASSSPEKTRYLGSLLFGLVKERIDLLLSEREHDDGFALNAGLVSETSHPSRKVLEQYRYMTGKRGYRQAMRRLGKACAKENIPIIVLSGGNDEVLQDIVDRRLTERFLIERVVARPVVETYFDKHYPGASKTQRRQLLWVSPHDPHPSKLGHTLYFTALLPAVERHVQAARDRVR